MTVDSHRNLSIDAYRAAVELGHQNGSKLIDAVMVQRGVMAQTYRFPVAGQVDPTTKDAYDEVTLTNPGSAKPTAILEPTYSFGMVDVGNEALTNAQWMAQQGGIHGRAISRQYDEHILAAANVFDSEAYTRSGLTAADMAYTTVTANEIDSDDLIECVARLKDEDADADCQFVYPARQFATFAKELKAAYWAFRGGTEENKRGGEGTMYGCTPRPIPQQTRRSGHGKIPDNRFYVWNKNDIGLAIGTLERLGVMDWIPMRQGYLIGGRTNAGATRIQNAGIVVGTIRT